MSARRQEELCESMAQAFVHAGITLSETEDPYLGRFLRAVNPGFAVPDRTTLAQAADLVAARLRAKAMAEALAAAAVSLTTDMAASVPGAPMEALTAHFLDREWRRRSVVLEVFAASGSGAGEPLANDLAEVLQQWNVRHIVSLATGGAVFCQRAGAHRFA